MALPLPRGYLRRPDGSVMLDPDEQVQATVRLVFALFERKGSVCGVLRHLADHDIRLPDRRRTGAGKGDLEWHRPNRATLIDMLHNPPYAGVYAYGRRSVEPSGRQPGRPDTGRRRGHDLDNGVIVLRDRMPAYLSWDRYMANLERMKANRSEHQGVPATARPCCRVFWSAAAAATAWPSPMTTTAATCAIAAAGSGSYGMPSCQSLAGPAG